MPLTPPELSPAKNKIPRRAGSISLCMFAIVNNVTTSLCTHLGFVTRCIKMESGIRTKKQGGIGDHSTGMGSNFKFDGHALFDYSGAPFDGLLGATSKPGKYLFGRRFEIQNFRSICCKISCLPASPRILEHLKKWNNCSSLTDFYPKKVSQNFLEPFFWLKFLKGKF